MNKTEMERKIAYLEFIHDQLETELSDVDRLLRSVGFPRGIESAKEVAIEILENQNSEKEFPQDIEDEEDNQYDKRL